MDAASPLPTLTLLPKGAGYRMSFGKAIHGDGATVDEALRALSEALRARLVNEKGDDSAEADTARRQADILANDRFLNANTLQNTVTMALALGLV